MARSDPDPAAALHLVLGAEPPVLEQTLEKIRGAHGVQAGDPAWEELHLDGTDLGPEELHAALASSSLFASKRLVLVRRADELSAETQELLVSLLAPLPAGVVLVLSARKVDQRTSFFKALKKGEIWELAAPTRPGDLARWTRAQAEAQGLALPAPVAQRLVEAVGGEAALIPGEVAKLASYRAGGDEVTPSDVDALVSNAWPGLPPYAIFDLVDAVSRGDARTALERFRTLIRRGEEPLRILAMLGRQWHLLVVAHGLRSEGKGRPEELVRLGAVKSTFEASKLLSLAASWDETRLARAVELTAAADAELKKGAAAPVTLELLVLRLSRLSSGRGGPPVPR